MAAAATRWRPYLDAEGAAREPSMGQTAAVSQGYRRLERGAVGGGRLRTRAAVLFRFSLAGCGRGDVILDAKRVPGR